MRGAFAVARPEAIEVLTPFRVNPGAAPTWRLTPRPTAASCALISEPVVRAAFNQPDGEGGAVEGLYQPRGPGCWPSRSATSGATSWWPPC